MKRILIVKTSSLGDIIHVYPVLNYLQAKFHGVKIDWIVEEHCVGLVKAHPYIDRTLTIASKKWRKAPFSLTTFREFKEFRKTLRECVYDVVFDLQGNVKSGLILSQVRSQKKVGFAFGSVPEWPNLLFTNVRYALSQERNVPTNIRQDYLSLVIHYFGEQFKDIPFTKNKLLKLSLIQEHALQSVKERAFNRPGPKVLVCPGSAWINKQLTVEALASFLKLLQHSLNCTLLFAWGSLEERLIAEKLQAHFLYAYVIEKLSLPVLQHLMDACDLVIAMDSLPLHLAGTTQTRSFSVFGASSSTKYKPLGDRHYAVQGICPYGKSFIKRCPILRTCATGACIHDFSGKEIFNLFDEWYHAIPNTTS